MSQQLSTQFTEDVAAQKVAICDRLACGKVIQIGEARHYIASHDFTKPGKHVCSNCRTYYKTRMATSVRNTVPTIPPAISANILASNHEARARINKDVNLSQRQGVHQGPPGLVVGMPEHKGPHVVPAHEQYQNYFATRTAPMPPPALPTSGYSSAHLQYHDARKNWSALASRGPTAALFASGTILIAFTASYETYIGKGKAKSGFGTVPHIREAERVNSTIRPFQIIALAKNSLLGPLSKLFPAFQWDFDDLAVREKTTWEDVRKAHDRDPDAPYFGDRFIIGRVGVSKGAARAPDMFKAPKNPIEFTLIITSEQWTAAEESYEEHLLMPNTKAGSSKVLETFNGNLYQKSEQVEFDTGFSRNEALVYTPPPSNKRKSPPSPKLKNHSTARLTKRVQNLAPIEVHDSDSDEPVADKVPKPEPCEISLELVQKGVLRGGKLASKSIMAKINKCTHEQIIYYPIHILPLHELLSGNSPLKMTDHQHARFGTISYVPDRSSPAFLGQGGFKTAFEADLNLSQSIHSGLGRLNVTGWTSVALKRPFALKDNGKAISRLSLVDEGQLVLVEANMLAWAHSLLNFAYSFIDHHITTHGPPADFFIPRLCFVDGAVVIPQCDIDPSTSIPVTNRAVYLIEEIIKGAQLPFLKYIHNADATPLQEPGEEGYNTGLFLCFIQHIQYIKTSRQVYISDCQGGKTLLTDPQIITNPDLGENLFGDGNVQEAFINFPEQHKCNKYCTWLGLKTLAAIDTNNPVHGNSKSNSDKASKRQLRARK